MEVFDMPQLSTEWWEMHRGRPTASHADQIVTPKQWKPSESSDKYIAQLVADVINPYWRPEESFVSKDAEAGLIFEDSNRASYAFENGVTVRQVGFCLSDCGRFGCSPDGLVGDDGGLELKHVKGSTQVKYLLNGGLPDEYKPQVHMSLLVTGREWWDFYSVCHGFPPLLVRVVPDGDTEKLKVALEKFWTKYQSSLSRVRGMEMQKINEDEHAPYF